jgi:hypothetical protein
MNESEKQFSFTRAASSRSGRAKSKFHWDQSMAFPSKKAILPAPRSVKSNVLSLTGCSGVALIADLYR